MEMEGLATAMKCKSFHNANHVLLFGYFETPTTIKFCALSAVEIVKDTRWDRSQKPS
jgi:hypothetical protein